MESTAATYLDPRNLLTNLKLAPGMWVGDFGVGSAGHFAIAIAEQVGAEGGVLMFDVVKSSLSGAVTALRDRGFTNCRSVWTNLEIYGGASGVADGTVDAGVLVNVLHQSRKPKDILAEVHRMLKVGATLLIVDWRPEAVTTIAPEKKNRLGANYVEELAKSVGFAPVSQLDPSQYHWGIVVAKT